MWNVTDYSVNFVVQAAWFNFVIKCLLIDTKYNKSLSYTCTCVYMAKCTFNSQLLFIEILQRKVLSPAAVAERVSCLQLVHVNKFHRKRVCATPDMVSSRCFCLHDWCAPLHLQVTLLWEDQTRRHLLASARLYFLPEDTPKGRTKEHGEVGQRGNSSSYIWGLKHYTLFSLLM